MKATTIPAPRTIKYNGSSPLDTRAAPKEDYSFFVMPPIDRAYRARLDDQLAAIHPAGQISVVDYDGATGIHVQRLNGEKLPLPGNVLSAIGTCAGHFVVEPLLPGVEL